MTDLYFKLNFHDPDYDLFLDFIAAPDSNIETTIKAIAARYPKIKGLVFLNKVLQDKPDYPFEFCIKGIKETDFHSQINFITWRGQYFQEDFLMEEEKSLLIEMDINFQYLYNFLNFIFVIRDHWGLKNSLKLIQLLKKHVPETKHVESISYREIQ